MRFDLIGPGYAGFNSQWDASRNVNLFPAHGAQGSKSEWVLLGTPGTILRFNVGVSPIRAMHPFGSALYVISGNQLYSISSAGAVTAIPGAQISTIAGNVFMKDNALQSSGTGGNQLMIVDGANGYIWNPATSTWSTISGGGWPVTATVGPTSLEYMDGYFVVGVTNSQAIYASNLYDGTTYTGLAFAYAQSASDSVQAFVNMQEQLCIIKQYTTEFWYDTGIAPQVGLPFARQTSAVIDYGTPAPASVSRGSGSIFMLANRRSGDSPNFIGAVQILNDIPTVITPPAIVKQMEAWAPWSDVVAFCYEQDGHSFWQVTSPSANQTFVYDASIGDPSMAWHERSTYVEGSFYSTGRHVANCYAYFNGMHLVGDWSTGNIYEMRGDIYQDNGSPLIAVRTSQIIADKKGALNSVNLRRLILDVQTGYGGNVAFSWSDDGGNTWSADYVHSMRASGDFRGVDPWMPLGQHPYGMIPRIAISDPVPRMIVGGYLE
jgi:hypothetical protein